MSDPQETKTPNPAARPHREPVAIEGVALDSNTPADTAKVPPVEPVPAPEPEPVSSSPAPDAQVPQAAVVVRHSKWPLPVAVLGGAALALLGALYLHANDDATGSITAIKADMEAASTKFDQRLLAADARADAQGKTLATLEQRLKSAEARIPSASGPMPTTPAANPPAPDTAGFVAQVSALDSRVTKIETSLAAPKLTDQITQSRIEQPKSGPDLAAQLVVAQSLLTNLERGAPFSAELTALKNLGVAADKLAPLAAGADKGLPTPAALAASLKKLSASMIATGAPAPVIPGQQSWLDRIATSASSLVKIRRDGDPANDDIAGKLAAMDGALAKGDVATAVANWDKLPVSAQTLSQDWVNQAKTRIASAQTAHALVDEAIAGLGSKKP